MKQYTQDVKEGTSRRRALKAPGVLGLSLPLFVQLFKFLNKLWVSEETVVSILRRKVCT